LIKVRRSEGKRKGKGVSKREAQREKRSWGEMLGTRARGNGDSNEETLGKIGYNCGKNPKSKGRNELLVLTKREVGWADHVEGKDEERESVRKTREKRGGVNYKMETTSKPRKAPCKGRSPKSIKEAEGHLTL